VAIFAFHGSVFLSLKTSGELRQRARRAAAIAGSVAVVLFAATVVWVAAGGRPWATASGALSGAVPLALALVAAVLLAGAVLLIGKGREMLAFVATGGAVLLAVGAIWSLMYPMAIPASSGAVVPGVAGVPIALAASQPYTLTVMTIVAAIFTPIVLLYQGWTYWVFRQRLVRPLSGPGPGSPRTTPEQLAGSH
jgi:cytochrome d ubiquinol oxidase subunit II